MHPDNPSAAETEMVRIPVRSHRQAMDWSLVLVSQGIETVIEHDDAGWRLRVEPRHSTDALKILRQYHLENRGWGWHQTLRWPAVHFDWGSVVWAAVLCLFFCLSTNEHFFAAGLMNYTRVFGGQWWRIFTAVTLHADIAHLATNLSIGILLVGLVMGRFGTGLGLLAAYLAGAAANVASLFLHSGPFNGLGASGMIMAALGMLAAQSLAAVRLGKMPRRRLFGGLAAGFMFFVLFGLAPGTDMVAHFSGFVFGVVAGATLTLIPIDHLRGFKLNVFALVFLGVVVASTWWLALT